nr:glycosyltransferase family 4 protein [Halogeometricum borinquense]
MSVDSVRCYHVSDLSESQLESTTAKSSGPVYVVFPSPAWNDFPRDDASPVYQTTEYEYGAVSIVTTSSTRIRSSRTISKGDSWSFIACRSRGRLGLTHSPALTEAFCPNTLTFGFVRVGIVTPYYPPIVHGGGEISVQLLANQLSSRVDSVEVFSFGGGDQSTVDGVTVHRFRKLPHQVMEVSNVFAYVALRRKLKRLASFDVLHAYNIALNPAVGRISSQMGVPSVATLNSYNLLPKSAFGVTADPPRRLYELLAMTTTGRILRSETKRIDRFITLSKASRDIYRENGFSDVSIDVVPNMFDPSFEVPEGDESTNGYQVLFVGSLITEKGVEYLIKAMSKLPSDVSLRVVGTGDQKDKLETLACELNVDSRVEFTGQIPYDRLRKYYATADLFVHPGVWPEPFGRTLLEAMQAGLPVVTTDIGGPSEIVPQDELRCPPRDPTALAETISLAREQTGIGTENRAYVTERYSPQSVVDQLCDVYRTAIDGC